MLLPEMRRRELETMMMQTTAHDDFLLVSVKFDLRDSKQK